MNQEKTREQADYKGFKEQAVELYKSSTLPDQSIESWRKLLLQERGSIQLDSFNPEEDCSATQIMVIEGDDKETSVTNRDLYLDRSAKNLSRFDDIFARATMAFSSNTVYYYTPPGKSAKIHIVHQLTEGKTAYPFTVIVADRGAEITVIEEFQGETIEEALWCPATFLYAEDASHIKHVSLRSYGELVYHFHKQDSYLGKDSTVQSSVIHSGGLLGKCFVQAFLPESGSFYEGLGLATGEAAEINDMDMTAEHTGDHSGSRLLYKTVMKDRAHSLFHGNLIIPPGVKGVDSHQLNRNIVLSKKARAESMPNLIVRAEGVSAEHGATVGELDTEAMFFLQSRGLNEDQARALLIQGFMADIIERLPLDEKVQHDLIIKLQRKLGLKTEMALMESGTQS